MFKFDYCHSNLSTFEYRILYRTCSAKLPRTQKYRIYSGLNSNLEKNRFVFRETRKSGKKSFRIALLATHDLWMLGSISSTYLRAAFTPVGPQSMRTQSSCQYLLTVLGSTCVKAVHRTLMKLSPDLNASSLGWWCKLCLFSLIIFRRYFFAFKCQLLIICMLCEIKNLHQKFDFATNSKFWFN